MSTCFRRVCGLSLGDEFCRWSWKLFQILHPFVWQMPFIFLSWLSYFNSLHNRCEVILVGILLLKCHLQLGWLRSLEFVQIKSFIFCVKHGILVEISSKDHVLNNVSIHRGWHKAPPFGSQSNSKYGQRPKAQRHKGDKTLHTYCICNISHSSLTMQLSSTH